MYRLNRSNTGYSRLRATAPTWVLVLAGAGFLAVVIGLIAGANWYQIHLAPQDSVFSLPALNDQAIPAEAITPAVDAPVWQWLSASASARLQAATDGARLATDEADVSWLIFTEQGQKVDKLATDEAYFRVDAQKYKNFVPKFRDDLIKLQLPTLTLGLAADGEGAYVRLADAWQVPAKIPGQLVYRVHTALGEAQPGQVITGQATIYLIPWDDYIRDLH
ncbi:hypothetical protein IJJ12_00625 [bacterium]|nr:hypothetical protein [bacterium]